MRFTSPASLADLKAAVPAAFATERDGHRTSDEYHFISTAEVISFLDEKGFGVCRAQQKKARTDDGVNSARHIIGFRPKDTFSELQLGEVIPEVLLQNGHDGTTSYWLYHGLYRLVCTNGMIVGDTFDHFQIVHRGDIKQQVLDGTLKIVADAGKLLERIRLFQDTKLSAARQGKFAQDAMSIRYGDNVIPFEPNELLQVRRAEDKGDDLWHVMNRVQENLMQGGQEYRTATGRLQTARPINRVTKDVIYNRQLWDLTEEFARAA